MPIPVCLLQLAWAKSASPKTIDDTRWLLQLQFHGVLHQIQCNHRNMSKWRCVSKMFLCCTTFVLCVAFACICGWHLALHSLTFFVLGAHSCIKYKETLSIFTIWEITRLLIASRTKMVTGNVKKMVAIVLLLMVWKTSGFLLWVLWKNKEDWQVAESEKLSMQLT